MKNKWLWIGLGLLVVAVGVYFWHKESKDKIQYRTAKVDRGNISVVISATGTLNALRTVLVGSQVSGTIAKLYADFNTKVQEGQLLAQLDPTFLQASVNEAQANVDKAQAQVSENQRTFQRTSDLSAKSLVSQAEMDAARTAYEAAKATLAQSKAALDRAKVNLRYATIKAPISGVVISRDVDVGQTVAASLSAPTIFTIAQDLRKMQVQASVDEADIGNVKVGQDVSFRVDSYPDETFHGVVTQIRLAPIITQNVVTYNVIIGVDNPDQKLMPGMTATTSIEVSSKGDVLRVPVQATRFTPPVDEIDTTAVDTTRRRRAMPRDTTAQAGRGQGQGRKNMQQGNMWARVWVLVDGKPVVRGLRRGLQDSRYIEVARSDLKEGDEVITGIVSAVTSTSTSTPNPLAPQRNPMGGGGGGRRGGI